GVWAYDQAAPSAAHVVVDSPGRGTLAALAAEGNPLLNDQTLAEVLLGVVKDPTAGPGERQAALLALAPRTEVLGEVELIDLATRDRDGGVRRAAVELLALRPERVTAASVLKVLDAQRDGGTRALVWQRLGALAPDH